jgi:hypothetical protein
VAQRTPAITPRQMPVGSRGVRTWPAIPVEKLPPPPDVPAIRMRGVQVALWRRWRGSLRLFGVSAVALAVAIIDASVLDVTRGFGAFVLVVAIIIAAVTLLAAAVGTLRTARIAMRLRRGPWIVYAATDVRIPQDLPIAITMTLGGPGRYPVRIRNSGRAKSLRGMIRPEVWFVGDPAKRGILTLSGGGEMVWTRPNPVVPHKVKPRKPVPPPKPPKPRKVKPISPEKAQRLAVKDAARRAKIAARVKAQTEKQKTKPPQPPKPPQPVRQPKLPKIRGGQKIKWQ